MKMIITSGGISEKIDNVRKITNSSSGKLGVIIANNFCKSNDIDKIYYVCSKHSLIPDNDKIEIVLVDGAMDLKRKIEMLLKNNKIKYFIHSMAVSDYMVDYVTNTSYIEKSINEKNNIIEGIKSAQKYDDSKISSYEDDLVIVLKKTPKIISIIKNICPDTYLVGFKLLDNVKKEKLIEVAKKLRDKNNCDLVVANDLKDINKDMHKAYIIDKKNNEILCNTKEEIAKNLVKKLLTN